MIKKLEKSIFYLLPQNSDFARFNVTFVLNSAPENTPFLPSSRLSHKYDSYTGTSRTIHEADITENDF